MILILKWANGTWTEHSQKKNIPKIFILISTGRNAHKTIRYKFSAFELAKVENKLCHILCADMGGVGDSYVYDLCSR